MKLIKYISVFFAVLILSGCGGIQPTYSNTAQEYVLARHILVKSEYRANEIIKRLNASSDKLNAFINIATYESEGDDQITAKSNGGNLGWFGAMKMVPAIDKEAFNMKVGTYSKYPVKTQWGYHILYLENKMTQQQYRQLQAEQNNKILERIAAYETNYMNEYQNILKTIPEIEVTYIQPYNKKESCKIWMGTWSGDKYFEEDSYKISWDGKCKDGYASGLGREIETADMLDKWGIAIYKKGKPTYYITKDNLSNVLYEGISSHDSDDRFGVETMIKEKANDIEVTTISGKRNYRKGIKLLSVTSPFWNGSYTYVKEYFNFQYKYFNNKANETNNNEFEFFIEDKNGKNGWAINKNKNSTIITGEYINNVATKLNLPRSYNQKADEILKEIYDAQQKAFQAQEQAKKVKKQYLKRICKDSVKVNFMDNDEYKNICNPKSELALMQKINAKLDKISEAKIAKLEQEKYNAQQQKEEQHRQELLQLERNRLAEIRRHNKEQEAAADAAHFQQGMKNLTDQINNMTPKTYNVNMYHY